MRKRTMRNIKFGIKVLAICGATAVTFSSIQKVHKAAEREEASYTMPLVAVIENGEMETEVEIEALPKEQTQAPEEDRHESLIGSMDWDAGVKIVKAELCEKDGNLCEYTAEFDTDEHAEMWLESRGKGGCPSTLKELLDDARAIKKMIKELSFR